MGATPSSPADRARLRAVGPPRRRLETRADAAVWAAERRSVLTELLQRERADRDREGEQLALGEEAA
jgi:hypothetical protein